MKRRRKAVPSAHIYAFPSARHRRIVAFIAAEMRKRPSADDAEKFLIEHLDIEWGRLAGLGITDAEIEQHCHAFAKAAWQIVFADRRTWGSMTERAVSRAVRNARREVAPAQERRSPASCPHRRAEGEGLTLPGRFRDAAYIKRHVEFVLTRPAEQGEQHVREKLNAIRRTLDEIGVDHFTIDAEVRRIEAKVRAELWRQVLTPGGDQ